MDRCRNIPRRGIAASPWGALSLLCYGRCGQGGLGLALQFRLGVGRSVLGADQVKGAVLVLRLVKRIGVRTPGEIFGLVERIGEVLGYLALSGLARMRDDITGDVVGIIFRQGRAVPGGLSLRK